ncbi:hypothetical protein AVEN_239758-1 [Araneus ventricosus]|uniref:Uncharacterized protein n=1 Tax=Araneus ventricosus TaxID=182803 RepID=A0A4Y2IH03_ARAVE|nr:hypothetical protein AVEN_239758-1 [Araneus ventricosus]
MFIIKEFPIAELVRSIAFGPKDHQFTETIPLDIISRIGLSRFKSLCVGASRPPHLSVVSKTDRGTTHRSVRRSLEEVANSAICGKPNPSHQCWKLQNLVHDISVSDNRPPPVVAGSSREGGPMLPGALSLNMVLCGIPPQGGAAAGGVACNLWAVAKSVSWCTWEALRGWPVLCP